MGRRVTIFLTISVLLAGFWGFFLLADTASRGRESMPLYSSRRYDPYGAAALVEFLKASNVPVRLLERPRLEPDDKGVLIQILPVGAKSVWDIAMKRDYTLRIDELQKWIADGNTVIQFTRGETPLMEKMGFNRKGKTKNEPASNSSTRIFDTTVTPQIEIQTQETAGKSPDAMALHPVVGNWTPAGRKLVGNASPLLLQSPAKITHTDKKNWIPLAKEGSDTFAGALRFGKGTLIVVGSPSVVLNHWLAEQGNLAFLKALTRDKQVIFDEWSHGIGQPGSIFGLIKKLGMLPVLLQIAFVLGLYTWSTRGHKHADMNNDIRRLSSAVEQVETLGYLYSRVLSRDEIILRGRKEVLRRLASLLRISPEAIETGQTILATADAEAVSMIMEATTDLKCPLKKIRLEAELAKVFTISHDFAEKRRAHGGRNA